MLVELYTTALLLYGSYEDIKHGAVPVWYLALFIPLIVYGLLHNPLEDILIGVIISILGYLLYAWAIGDAIIGSALAFVIPDFLIWAFFTFLFMGLTRRPFKDLLGHSPAIPCMLVAYLLTLYL